MIKAIDTNNCVPLQISLTENQGSKNTKNILQQRIRYSLRSFARHVGGGLFATILLSSFSPNGYSQSNPSSGTAETSDTAPAEQGAKKRQRVSRSTGPIRLAPNTPSQYTVVKGDTLWAISGRFLQDPFRWPDVWEPNKDHIKNPHWIYPGDVIYLVMVNGRPVLRTSPDTAEQSEEKRGTVKYQPRIRASSNESVAISTISTDLIAPFLQRPLVVDPETMSVAPKVVALPDGRVMASKGELVYVEGDLSTGALAWHVYRPNKKLVDPETQEVLAYEVVQVATVQLESDTNPASMRIIHSKAEINIGDRLVPAPPPDLSNYIPHSPKEDVSGRVLGIYGDSGISLSTGGARYVTVISKGTRDGIDRGTVLALTKTGRTVSTRENWADRGEQQEVSIPDADYGLVLVFSAFEKVSYALIMSAELPVVVGDIARKP